MSRPLHRLHRDARANGFTLVEVLVALVITSVGLLGLARMQALALSTTRISGVRAMVALQTGSLASSMHANPQFWATIPEPLAFSASGDQIVVSRGTLGDAGSDACTTYCTPDRMGAADVRGWIADLRQQFPDYAAHVDCTGAGPAPVNCRIAVTWTEHGVAANGSAPPGATAGVTTESFTVIVKP